MAVLCGGVLLAPAAQAHPYLQGDYYTTLGDALGDFDNQLDTLFTTYTGCPSWSTTCNGTAVWTTVTGQNKSYWDNDADHGATISPAWAAQTKGVNDWKSFAMLEEILRTDTCLAGIGLNARDTIRSTFAANLAKAMPEVTINGVRVRGDVTYIIGITLDWTVNVTTGATNHWCGPTGIFAVGDTCFDVDLGTLESMVDDANVILDDSVRNMTAAYMTVGDYRGVYYWKSFMGRLAFSFIRELLPGLLANLINKSDGSVYIPTDNPGDALAAVVLMGLKQATMAEGDDKATVTCTPWGTVNDLHLDKNNGLPATITFDGGSIANPQIDIAGGSICTAVTNFANNYDIGAGKYSERNQYLSLGTAAPNQGNLNRDTGNTELNKTSYDAVSGDLDAWLKREGARMDFYFTSQPTGPAAPTFMGTHTFTAGAYAPTSVAIYWYYSDNGTDWTLAAGGTSYTPTFDFYSFGGDVVSRQYQARAVTTCGSDPYTIYSNIITVNNVTPPPITFTTQPPATSTAVPGQVVTMPAVASCAYGYITYQWQKWDGAAWQNVSGATNATLNLGTVSAAAAGQYRCLAYNQVSTKGTNPVYYQASNTATLNVAPDIVISQQPVGGDFAIGASHTMNITATVASGALTYQWQRNVGFGFQNMAGQTGTSVTLNAMTVNDAGSYRCVVTNTHPTYGVYSIFSASAVVNVSSGFVVFVDPTSPGPENGLTWATAFHTLQPAINLVSAQPTGGEVWVAGGSQAVPIVYNEARTEAWGAPASVAGSLVMKDNTAVYGGFQGYRSGAGKLEANRRDRNRWQNVATIAAPAGAYHVVVFGRQTAATLNSTLDGFIIQGGNAAGVAGDYHTWRGGGIFNWQSAPTIANCVIASNTAATAGGGIANVSSLTLSANPQLMNLVVTGNTANRTDDGYLGGSPMRGGGGIFNDKASPTITWLTVLNNTAPAGGSVFGAAGAGMYTFKGSPAVSSSIFWGNSAGELEDNTTFGDLSATTVTYSDTTRTSMAWAGDGSYTFPLASPAPGTGNIYTDPQLVNWIPQAGSPVIDKADPMLAGDDITGAIRPVDGDAVSGAVPDMGAVEWVHAPSVACLSAALNISLQTSITDPLTLFDGTNSNVEGGIWYLEVAANTFGCGNIPGPMNVRVTVHDNRGQTSYCDAPVSAFETTNPTVVTNTITRQLNGAGSYSLTNADVQALGAGSSDNCGINWAASSVTPSTLSCASLGTTNVTITVVDTSGNSASGTAQVVMQDVTAPTAVGATISVNLDLAGSYTLSSGDMQALGAGSTDNCTVNAAATTATPSSFSCANIGANSVTVTVYDTSGNSSTATGTVNVNDVTPPIVSGVSPKSFITPGPDFTMASALSGVTATDVCAGAVSVTVECRDAGNNLVAFPIPDTFDTGSVYPYTFTLNYSAPDGHGNTGTASTTLTLQNNTPPVITITGGTPVSVQCGSTYTDQGATASDAESGDLSAFVSASGLPINTSTTGTHTVTYSVQDPVTFVTVTRDRIVNVVDTTPPTVVGNNITRALATTTYTLSAADIQALGAGSSDACGGINWATSTATPSSFTCANVGTPVNVTLTLRDNANNSASTTVQVTITDSTQPVLSGVVARSFRTPGPDFTSAQALSGVSATDNCATGITPTVVCRDASNNVVAFPIPDTYPTGGVYPYTFTLTYTANDGNGNTATQVANLVLTQNLPPVITVLGDNPATVECGATYTDAGATVDDPDDPDPSIVTTGLPVTTTSVGSATVTYQATDVASGVVVTATRTVNIVDTTGPTVVTTNLTRNLPVSNTYTITVADRQAMGAGSSDTCGTIDWNSSLITPGTFTCANVGANNVTITVRDSNGNATVGNAVITIVDNTPPVISGVSNKAFMTPGADFTLAQALSGVTASDTCTGNRTANITVVCRDALNNVVGFPVPDTFPTGGTYPYIFTLNYSVTDGNGNSASQTANLTLTNDNPPVITILGDNPATVQCGSAYTDAGATASDVESGTLTVSVVSGLPVDTSAVASTNVVYSVTDPVTSVVVTATRVVNVVDTTAPTVVCNPVSVTLVGNAYTLTPADIQTIGAGSSDACGGIDWANSTVVPSAFTCANVGTPVNVTLTVFDTAGLSSACSTTVTVLDNTPPVLSGVSAKAFRTPGADFTSAQALSGVTATDTCAGTLTGSVTVTCRDAANNVVAFPVPDTYPTGGVYPYTFSLTYSVSDGHGNTTTQVANLVLTQNLPPVITVLGADPATVECGSVYTDAGATVDDPDDPDPVLNTSGLPISTASPNTFTVTYSAIDVASGVEVTETRTVHVVDTTGPTLVLNNIDRNLSSGAFTLGDVGRAEIIAGSTDSCGTINTTATMVTPSTFTCANRGPNTVNVTVYDSNGNSSTGTATITIHDVTAPFISGVSDKAFMTPGPDFTQAQALAGVSATDTCDGARTVNVECRDASNNVVAFPVADTYPTGGLYPYVFTLTYTSSDTSGNTRTQVANLTLTDDNPPVITILGANPATVECGATYTDDGATASDIESGDLTSQINTTGLPVPVGAPGTYAVVYSVTDPLTSVTVSESRQVDVVDTAAPTLTLFGAATVGVAIGGVYTEPGFTASDVCAGDLTSAVAVGGDTVNTSVAGTYVLTYDVTDGYNSAPQQTRTVVVANLLWFSTQPAGATVYSDAAPLTLTAVFEDGMNPSTYQWFVAANGGAAQAIGAPAAVPGDRTLTLAVDPAVYGAGSYVFHVSVTDDTGARSSAAATVVIGDRMSVGDGLEDTMLTLGADFTWSITVTGGIGSLNYQWLKDDGSKAFVPVSDGGGIGGSATAALDITGFTADMAGDYEVEVSDDYDTITVGPATLSLGSGLPVAGGLGLAALAALTALGGAVTIRRRK